MVDGLGNGLGQMLVGYAQRMLAVATKGDIDTFQTARGQYNLVKSNALMPGESRVSDLVITQAEGIVEIAEIAYAQNVNPSTPTPRKPSFSSDLSSDMDFALITESRQTTA